MPTEEPPRRLSRRERTRANILDACVDLLQSKDWQDITLEEIGLEADCVKATVLDHFGTKADLLGVVGQTVIAGIAEARPEPAAQVIGSGRFSFEMTIYEGMFVTLGHVMRSLHGLRITQMLWLHVAGAHETPELAPMYEDLQNFLALMIRQKVSKVRISRAAASKLTSVDAMAEMCAQRVLYVAARRSEDQVEADTVSLYRVVSAYCEELNRHQKYIGGAKV